MRYTLAVFILFTIKLAYCKYPIFYLYTRTNPNTAQEVDEVTIKNSAFSNTRKTYLIIHGWNGQATNNWMLQIKNNLLAKENANVFCVDWSEGSSGVYYPSQAGSVSTCGNRVGTFLRAAGITAANVHCIGHSLGAHVCGFTGKTYKIGRITGMDPAGPGFKGKPAADRLAKTDATYVDVIHTDSTFGIQDQIGHKDFYPNGGATQAGCSGVGKREDTFQTDPVKGEFITSWISCSHSRVTDLYAESVTTTCRFAGTPCTSYDDWKNNRCGCSALGCPSLGHNSINVREEGRYYLNTNSKSPFCV